MALWRFLLLFALTFGSVLPHCATAAPVSVTASHHIGMGHDQHPPSKAHISDACVGCATPVRFAFAEPAAPMRAKASYVAVLPTLTTRMTALDPPPPRLTT